MIKGAWAMVNFDVVVCKGQDVVCHSLVDLLGMSIVQEVCMVYKHLYWMFSPAQ